MPCSAAHTLMLLIACLLAVQLSAQTLPSNCRQLIVVRSKAWNEVTATLTIYERSHQHAAWKQIGMPYKVVVGKNGMAWDARQSFQPQDKQAPYKQEGDGKSPAGIFPLLYAYGYDSLKENWKFPYVKVNRQTLCIDDPHSRYYNQIINKDTVPHPDWKSHEEMRRTDELYRWGIVVGYNSQPVQAGSGSCIFIHLHSNTPQPRGTAGCTAMQGSEILQLLRWLDASQTPLLIQMPESEWQNVRRRLRIH
ncbi:MAG: L,D-transpeptidase family protein [Cytophagales bacterium]|nr:L,D-transpeptidase family protein [Cytophagales bacterium]